MKSYRKKQTQLMFRWTSDTDMSNVSISDADIQAGSPKEGDMIAVNPNNPTDRWLVAADFFNEYYEEAVPSNALNLEAELIVQQEKFEDLKTKYDTVLKAFFGFAIGKESPDVGYRLLTALLCETNDEPRCSECEQVIRTYQQKTKITPSYMQQYKDTILEAQVILDAIKKNISFKKGDR